MFQQAVSFPCCQGGVGRTTNKYEEIHKIQIKSNITVKVIKFNLIKFHTEIGLYHLRSVDRDPPTVIVIAFLKALFGQT